MQSIQHPGIFTRSRIGVPTLPLSHFSYYHVALIPVLWLVLVLAFACLRLLASMLFRRIVRYCGHHAMIDVTAINKK